VFKRLDSTYLDTSEIATVSRYSTAHGLVQIVRTVEPCADGKDITLIKVRFADGDDDLCLRDDDAMHVTAMEIAAEDVSATFEHLHRRYPGVRWVREPFVTPQGHLAVVEVPGQTVLVLVGKVA
jgi:hypothetical protein